MLDWSSYRVGLTRVGLEARPLPDIPLDEQGQCLADDPLLGPQREREPLRVLEVGRQQPHQGSDVGALAPPEGGSLGQAGDGVPREAGLIPVRVLGKEAPLEEPGRPSCATQHSGEVALPREGQPAVDPIRGAS